MSFPKYMIGTGSLAVFKMFSPELGYALTTGCGMQSGTIITSLQGLRDVPVEYGAQFDDNDYTAERVDAERQLGVARLPIDGPVTGVPVKDIIGNYKLTEAERTIAPTINNVDGDVPTNSARVSA